MSLNSVLHDIAHAVGMNKDHPIHADIDAAVEPDKDEEKGEEDKPNA